MRAAMTATVVVLALAAEVSSAEAAGNPETVGGQLGTLIETVTAPVLPELSPPTSARSERSSRRCGTDAGARPGARLHGRRAEPRRAAGGSGRRRRRGSARGRRPRGAARSRRRSPAAARRRRARRHKRRQGPGAHGDPAPTASRILALPIHGTRLRAAAAGLPDRRPAPRPGPGAGRGGPRPGAPLPAFAFYAALVAALGSLWLASRRSLGIRADRDRWRL